MVECVERGNQCRAGESILDISITVVSVTQGWSLVKPGFLHFGPQKQTHTMELGIYKDLKDLSALTQNMTK